MADSAQAVLSVAMRTAHEDGGLEDALLALVRAAPRDEALITEAISLAQHVAEPDHRTSRAVSILRGALATGLFTSAQPIPPSRYETGMVEPDDGYLHASAQRLTGKHALCGTGRIGIEILGRFDPYDARACPRCARAARPALA